MLPILIILLLFNATKSAINNYEDPNTPLINYIHFVYKTYAVVHNGYVGIVINDQNDYIIDKTMNLIFRKQMSKIFLVNFGDKNSYINIQKMKKQKLFMGYIELLMVFLNETETFMTAFNKLHILPLFQPRTRILLIFSTPPSEQKLRNLFDECWNKNILNIVTIFQNITTRVITYNPFWNIIQDFTNSSYTKNIYYDKLSNLNGYKLNFLILKDDDKTKIRIHKNTTTGAITYGGKDINIMKNLIQRMNASATILTTSDYLTMGERNPWRLTNEVGLNMIAIKSRIITGQNVDLLNTDEMILNDDLSGITESLYPHEKDDMVILIPKGKKIPYYLYMFMVFRFEIWCLNIFILISIMVFWCCVRNLTFTEWSITYLDIIRIIVGGSVPLLPQINSERILLMNWLIYTFILLNIFQSKLTSILMEPKYYPDIENLEQLDASGLNIGAYRIMIDEMDEALRGSSKYGLIAKMTTFPARYDMVNISNVNFDSSFFQQPLIINYNRAVFCVRSKSMYIDGRPILHIVKESPLPKYLAFQVPAGSPYLHKLNKILRLFQETGLLTLWNKISEYADVINGIQLPENYADGADVQESLTLLHLQTAFMFLLIGYLLSTIIFMGEKIYYIFNNTI